jgi:two-component system response regulator
MMGESRYLLLVEDDPNDVTLLLRALRKEGFPAEVRVLRDGQEAVDFLAAPGPRPGLIVLDLKLPRKIGFEVLAWLRRESELRQTPVAILTSSREPSDLERAKSLGANWYLVKAVSFTEIRHTARTIHSYWSGANP